MLERGWGIGNPVVCYWWVRLLTTKTHYVMLMACQWIFAEIQDWMLEWRPLHTHLYVQGNRNSICWEILILLERLYDGQVLHFVLSCMSYPVLNWFCGMLYWAIVQSHYLNQRRLFASGHFTNLSDILMRTENFAFEKMHFKMLSLNVLNLKTRLT